MDREEVERIRRTPGVSDVPEGMECSLTVWHVDNNNGGEVTPLGLMSYWHPNPVNRWIYKKLRKRGLI